MKHLIPNIFTICILSILILMVNCSDSEREESTKSSELVSGSWRISPSDEEEKMDFDAIAGAVVVTKNSIPFQEEFNLIDDGVGIRIQKNNETSPKGYFLYNDRRKGAWTGIWKDELVRLIRVN
ncbi:MAG: hypothetical protein JJT78_06330 [Leptospira sp.]|nr:hypothetical protein [Leptospira sp.]